MKNSLLLLLMALISFQAQGQDKWSLEDCVQYAWDNSLRILQAENTKENDILTVQQLKHQRWPSLNASSNFGVNFGRSINPATNNFETENSYFNSLSLSSGINLFNGNRLNNSIKQSQLNMEASTFDIQQAKNSLALDVALTYLNVLFAYENLTIAETSKEITQQQLDQIEKLISAGARPEAEKYDILAQLASDEENIINAQNNVDINLLGLQQLMLLDVSKPFDIERPEIDLDNIEAFENYAFDAVFSAAMNNFPQVKANNLRMQSAEMGVDIAKGSTLPSLNMGASIGSNWSDLGMQPIGFQTVRNPWPGVYIGGDLTEFAVEDKIPTGLEGIPYFDQLDNNLGYGANITLSIPIYNNYQVKTNIERAKLGIVSTQISNEQVIQTLRSDIQNALTAAKASRKSLDASEQSLKASEIAFQNAEKRFNVGSINTFDYLNARSRLDNARVNVVIAKYDYLFKAKVIEYYLGRGVYFND